MENAVLGRRSRVDLLWECVDLLSQFFKLAVLGTGSSVDLLWECVDLGTLDLWKTATRVDTLLTCVDTLLTFLHNFPLNLC